MLNKNWSIDNTFLFWIIQLIAFGTLIMYSASSPFAYNQYNKPDTFFFFKQIIWLSVGILALIFLSLIFLKRYFYSHVE